MTEAEWDACNDPTLMLESVRGKVSGRKLRLFCCACSRRVWHLLVHPVSRAAIEVAERFADGLASDSERDRVYGAADDIRCLLGGVGTGLLEKEAEEEFGAIIKAASITPDVAAAAADEAWGSAEPEPENSPGIGAAAAEAIAHLSADGGPNARSATEGAERAAQAVLLRDILGNPRRPASNPRRWLKPNIDALAKGIYDDRAFDRLPLLADPLEDAGCADAELLAHLHGPGPHVRGCWAVDLLLGKS